MTFEEFQQEIIEARPGALDFGYCALGFVCEAGEVGDVVKKMWRDMDPALQGERAGSVIPGKTREKRIEDIVEESGDALFYLVRLWQALGIDPGDVFQRGSDKLEELKAKGKTWG